MSDEGTRIYIVKYANTRGILTAVADRIEGGYAYVYRNGRGSIVDLFNRREYCRTLLVARIMLRDRLEKSIRSHEKSIETLREKLSQCATAEPAGTYGEV